MMNIERKLWKTIEILFFLSLDLSTFALIARSVLASLCCLLAEQLRSHEYVSVDTINSSIRRF